MIKVADAIMGTGKTSAAIQHMNEHPEKRYLFITPYNDETERIKKACPSLDFWIPSKTYKEYDFTKSGHMKALVAKRRNVALTHALYMILDDETVKLIIEAGYVIFIDEVIDVFAPLAIRETDLDIIISSGWLVCRETDGESEYEYYEQAADKEYQGGRFHDLFTYAKGHRLVNLKDSKDEYSFHFWTLHRELMELSKEIYILTYMFEGSPLKAFLEMHKIPYEYIGVGRDDRGTYRFCENTMIPDYVAKLGDKIHICDNAKLNAIGMRRTSFSVSWSKDAAKRAEGNAERLRRNLVNYFRYYAPSGIDTKQKLWCTVDALQSRVRAKGHSRQDAPWNQRATNKYRECIALAYCVNVFPNPNIIHYLALNNASIDEEKFAVASMVQWIWRSAIREGRDIWIYIPSRRMRKLLKSWIADVERQYHEYASREGVVNE